MFRLSPFFPNDCLGRKVTRFLPSAVLFKWEWNQSRRQLFWSHCNVAQDTITSSSLVLNILSTAPLFVATKDWNGEKEPWWMIEAGGLQLWYLNCDRVCLLFSLGKATGPFLPQLLFLGRDVEQEIIFPSQSSGTRLAFSRPGSKFEVP